MDPESEAEDEEDLEEELGNGIKSDDFVVFRFI